MKLAIKLAFRNLMGAGLRTWLNVIVLSFSFVIIIWLKGVMTGWDQQSKLEMKNWEIGGGQYWHEKYDPYDPFTLDISHSVIPAEFRQELENGDMEQILLSQGTVYPQGRIQSVVIRGIDPGQNLFYLPAHKLDTAVVDAIPAFIGYLMADNLKAETGDRITL